jgi:putative tryptophan/tyrosine transport system substrate-binding protein
VLVSPGGERMRRREFITLLGGAAVAWPLEARAQQPAMPVIGFIHTGLPEMFADETAAFRRGLNQIGYIEGRNVVIEYHWVQRELDPVEALVADLVRRQVAAIVAVSLGPALAAKAATQTIPIVFSVGGDPVKLGLVTSFNRPGGNVTGISQLNNVLAPKQLEILHELVPKVTTIAMLVNPSNPNAANDMKNVQVAAQILGLQLLVLRAGDLHETEAAFSTMVEQRVGALLVGISAFIGGLPDYIIPLATRHAIPAIYPWRDHAVAGGLMSYGSDQVETGRQVGVYTGRILKGVKPADLPVWEAVKVELILNLKTANALGLTFPLSLLGRADEVIE